jgi:phosphoglycerate dehydrogenase-like enzyme
VSARPKALLAFSPARNPDTVSSEQHAELVSLVELVHADPVESFTCAGELLREVEVLVTGWGAPRVSADALALMPALRLIAHVAGSVKGIVDPVVWERGVLVTSAAHANAIPVAEYTLAAILFSNKRVLRLREFYRETHAWPRPLRDYAPGLGNYRKVVGVIGASRTGRRLLELLRAFSFEVLLYDPYVTSAEAAALGAQLVALDALVSSADVVTLHAPENAQTRHMFDARRLSLLRDGSTLINTARGSLVDTAALVTELRSGRIDAVLDVTDPEPLPVDSPLYVLPNVLLTPHIAGAAGMETQRLTEAMLGEIRRYIAGEPLQFAIAAADVERLA